MKRIVTLLLALMMCVGIMIPVSAQEREFDAISSLADYPGSIVMKQVALYEYTQSGELRKHDAVYPGYNIVGSDTRITLWNDAGSENYSLLVMIKYYEKQGGKNVMTDVGILCSDGVVRGTSDLDNSTVAAVTGTGALEVPGSAFYRENTDYYEMIITRISYSNAQQISTLFIIDDDKADQIIKKGKNPDDPGNPFDDVPMNAYYHDAVLWALKKDITTGTSKTTFGPFETCTRGQVATFLWRSKGCPKPKTTDNPFADVKETDYFYDAVLWAFENGITTGTSETTFSPNGTCTAAQVLTFLWRAKGEPEVETDGTQFYAEAVAWAEKKDLFDGIDTPFVPENLSPRADIVTYLYRAK